MMVWQKRSMAFSTGIVRNAEGKWDGSGSNPTQSRLFCWREAVNIFSRKLMMYYLLGGMENYPTFRGRYKTCPYLIKPLRSIVGAGLAPALGRDITHYFFHSPHPPPLPLRGTRSFPGT